MKIWIKEIKRRVVIRFIIMENKKGPRSDTEFSNICFSGAGDSLRYKDAGESWSQIDHYKHLSERLRSFNNPGWPSDVPVTSEELARAGWFYVGRDDRVQCPWCGGCVFNWVPGDSALGEHRRHFPHCDFVCDYMAKAFEHISKCSGRCIGTEEQKIILAKNSVSEMGFADEIIEEASKVLLQRGKWSAL